MEPPSATCGNAPEPNTGRPPRLLFVGDDHMLREIHAFLFALHGWSCRNAPSGSQALLDQREFAPDVAVLELNMPEISGFKVAAQLRTAQPSIGLIAYSGDIGEWGADELSAVGFDVALTKGCGFETLEAVARHLLG